MTEERAVPPEIRALLDQLTAADSDAEGLVAGLSEAQGTRQPTPGSWSVAQCLDHLATANQVYLQAMQAPAQRARAAGRFRTLPATPGVLGRWFVSTFEPPPRWWSRIVKAPRRIRPRPSPSLETALASFMASQRAVREFIVTNADLDLAVIPFPNPFVRGLRLSMATGLHVIAAHDRRHLLQAWRTREAVLPYET